MGGKVIDTEMKVAWRDGVKEGMKEGKTEAIRDLMSSLKISAEQAMDALKIPKKDRESYLSMLNKL